MFFLNLSAGEFITLLGALGGLVTALYLLDRTRRKKVVSSLRFWIPGSAAVQQQSRRRVREPWSLILQLASLLCLLLAIGQLEWGTRNGQRRDHVLLLDTSAWAGQRTSDGFLLDREKAAAREYLTALPPQDRVMLVRVDALAAPATPFTSDRSQLLGALRESSASLTALNLAQSLSFAAQAEAWSDRSAGEAVYIGPKLVKDSALDSETVDHGFRLRTITVPADPENCGIRSLSVKRSEDEPNSWLATVTVKNFGARPRLFHLHTAFAGTVFAPRPFNLAPGKESTAQYTFVTDIGGPLTVRLEPHDALSADDRTSVQLPPGGSLRIAAFTNRAEILRPLLDSNPRLSVSFLSPSAYVPKPSADIILLDQFAPPDKLPPLLPALWIEPPPGAASPLPIRTVVKNATGLRWQSDAAFATGLRAREVELPRVEVFETFPGDEPLASVAQGAVVVLRTRLGENKSAVVGFDPLSGAMRYEVTTPLLFANLLRWLSPESFRSLEIAAGRVGTAAVTLDKAENSSTVRVTDASGFAVPFTIRDQTLELFTGRPSVIRISSSDRDRTLSLTLPDVADVKWNPGSTTATGLPPRTAFAPGSLGLWRWLASLAAAGLFAEWLLYGRHRTARWRPTGVSATPVIPDSERDLVSS